MMKLQSRHQACGKTANPYEAAAEAAGPGDRAAGSRDKELIPGGSVLIPKDKALVSRDKAKDRKRAEYDQKPL